MTAVQTGEKTAVYCLTQHDWKLDIALDNYFANPEVRQLGFAALISCYKNHSNTFYPTNAKVVI